MHPRVSVNLASGWNWSLDEHLAFLAGSGIAALSLTSSHLGEDREAAIARVRACGLPVDSLGTGAGSLIVSEAATLARLGPAIDDAAALGSPSLFTITGPTPSRMPTGEACALLVRCLAGANAHARSLGLRLAIEHSSPALRSHGFVCSLADAVTVAAEADVAVAVELQNCWYERDLARLFRDHAARFAIVQCSDFAVGEELRMNRRVPGDGDMPLEWMIGELLEAGYGGYFDLEILGPAIEAEGYAAAIMRGAEWLARRLTAWGV